MSERQDDSPTRKPARLDSNDPTSSQSDEGNSDRSAGARLRHDRSTAEISGETIDVVGEATGEFPRAEPPPGGGAESTGRSAIMVGAGILISRIIGVIRQRVFAYYFGNSLAADAFTAAFRIPNFLQNVFGEGALSASFIPVYANLLARKDEREASRVASAVLTLLALVTSIIVLVGVITTPYIISVVALGFAGERRDLAIQLVQIFFPGAGLLVMSAWCLGVLNSHRKFFLSYTAPVVWNVAIIASMIFFGGRNARQSQTSLAAFQAHLAVITAWGSVIGSGLQFAVQLPTVLWLARGLRPVLDVASTNVRTVIRNFFPVFMSRGVVQISAFVDAALASLVPYIGAVAALNYAQSLYTLPVSLFGMSVSAAELPAMSSALGSTDEIAHQLRDRLDAGLKRIAVFIVPSSMAMLALGDVITACLYQTGQFKHDDARYVWGILAGSTVGLLASTLGRLYASTYYALHDTRSPLRYAIVRVCLTTGLGYLFAIPLPPLIGIDPKWGVAGLTVSAGIAGWVEFVLLRRTLNRRIGRTGLPLSFVVKLWLGAFAGAAVAWAIKIAVGARHPVIVAALVLIPYGLVYFAVVGLLKVPEANVVIRRALKMIGIKKRR
jgi:putative peptidoglycan lipid II flippase